MKFWDSSAIVPLLVHEESSERLRSLLARDSDVFVWWGCEVECISALARRERDGSIHAQALTAALERLKQLAGLWEEIDPTDAVREAAARFVRVHPLRAADALQLAAAFLAAEQRPSSLTVVTLDERLAGAARKEGFVVMGLTAE
ncbi:MAG TPA: type II toxin-antitoxin system VapC family toxin [Xanthobacteraceae bacterium]|nr:type II toxin-antitoxin system VapC family toxin [Xanthobacteraceae bacterium]